MYIRRTISESIEKCSRDFKVVLVTGARQVGKSTVLREIGADREYVTLDDFGERELAVREPKLFLQRHKPPVTIDEIQYAVNLLPYIKMAVDNSDRRGDYWLTGSQHFSVMKGVTESLAGRVAVLEMHALSLCEADGRDQREFCPDADLAAAGSAPCRKYSSGEIFSAIQRGFYPELHSNPSMSAETFYESYLRTYVERDIRDLNAVKNEMDFVRFMRLVAARTGQVLVFSELAKDAGVSQITARNWISILVSSGIVCLLQPYYRNVSSRMIKSPKMYFMDTGLCCHLAGWTNGDVLEKGACSGAMLETFAVSEIVKSFAHNGRRPPIYYYRDKDKREIDVLVERDGRLHPVEIKQTASPEKGMCRNFSAIPHDMAGFGALLCLDDRVMPLSDSIASAPVWWV